MVQGLNVLFGEKNDDSPTFWFWHSLWHLFSGLSLLCFELSADIKNENLSTRLLTDEERPLLLENEEEQQQNYDSPSDNIKDMNATDMNDKNNDQDKDNL